MSAADDLLTRMRRRQAGWSPDDFETLFIGFGFEKHEGGNHTRYRHPRFPQLSATVARHRELSRAYARDALKLIDELKRLQAEEEAKRVNP